MAPSQARTEQAQAGGGSFPSALVTALLGLLLALAMVIAPKLRRDAEAAGPITPPRPPTYGPERPISFKRMTALIDPAIKPMAGDAFTSMADENDAPPEDYPDAPDDSPVEPEG